MDYLLYISMDQESFTTIKASHRRIKPTLGIFFPKFLFILDSFLFSFYFLNPMNDQSFGMSPGLDYDIWVLLLTLKPSGYSVPE